MYQLQRRYVLYSLAHSIGTNQPGSQRPRFPTDRMPMGLLEYMTNFFAATDLNKVSYISMYMYMYIIICVEKCVNNACICTCISKGIYMHNNNYYYTFKANGACNRKHYRFHSVCNYNVLENVSDMQVKLTPKINFVSDSTMSY